jgi:hypothetical protein
MATKADLIIDQGTTFSTELSLKDGNGDPLNLNGFTSNSALKKWYTSQNSVPFTTFINTAAGSITLELDANTTTSLPCGRYVYDVNVTEITTGSVSRVIEGMITVTPSVTSGIFSTNNTWFANGYSDG